MDKSKKKATTQVKKEYAINPTDLKNAIADTEEYMATVFPNLTWNINHVMVPTSENLTNCFEFLVVTNSYDAEFKYLHFMYMSDEKKLKPVWEQGFITYIQCGLIDEVLFKEIFINIWKNKEEMHTAKPIVRMISSEELSHFKNISDLLSGVEIPLENYYAEVRVIWTDAEGMDEEDDYIGVENGKYSIHTDADFEL